MKSAKSHYECPVVVWKYYDFWLTWKEKKKKKKQESEIETEQIGNYSM